MVIDFGCAKELGTDACISVASQFLHGFSLDGNPYGRAPELFMELEAAKREVIAAQFVAGCTLVSAISPFSCWLPRCLGCMVLTM